MDERLSKAHFFAGEAISVADLALYAYTHEPVPQVSIWRVFLSFQHGLHALPPTKAMSKSIGNLPER